MSREHPRREDSPVTRRGVAIAPASAPAAVLYNQVAVPIVYLPDFDDPLLHFNTAARAFFGIGVSEERFYIKRHYRLTDPGGLDRGFAELDAGRPATLTLELLDAEGRWVSAELVARADPPGKSPSVGAVITIRTPSHVTSDRPASGTSSAEAGENALGAPRPRLPGLDTPVQLRSFRDALFASSEIAISVSEDYTKDLLVWNEAFFRLLGLDPTATKPSSQAFFACVHPDDRARMIELGTAIATGEISEWQNECRLITDDGDLRHVNGHGLATFDDTGKRILVAVLIDVTNERRRAAEAKSALADLERLTASISHDLRAPVRHLESFCGLIKESVGKRLTPEDAVIMRYAEDGINKLSAMIEGIVEYSRLPKTIERGRRLDTEAVVREIIGKYFPRSAERIEIGPLPEIVGDGTLVGRLFGKLIDNALKFSETADDTRISISGHTRDNGYAVIEVADYGAGFEDRYRHKLFEMFQRLHTAEEYPGFGTGLAIAHQIVRLHGGIIDGRHEGGKTSFTIELPLPGASVSGAIQTSARSEAEA